jgi:hypothetical protein
VVVVRNRVGAPRRWTQRIIVDELRRLHESGLEVTVANLIAAGGQTLVHAISHFGGLRRLRPIAGLPHRRKGSRQSVLGRDAVIAEIRGRHEEGLSVASSRVPPTLQYAGRCHFGTWKDALEAAGLSYEHIRLWRSYTDDELFEMLRSLARRSPLLTVLGLQRHRIGSTLFARFGSVEAAARLAGIDSWPLRKKSNSR